MGDWNFGSAISIFMMIIILISMAIMNKFDGTDKEGRRWTIMVNKIENFIKRFYLINNLYISIYSYSNINGFFI